MTQTIERSGDMGQGTKLTLLKDYEGDIHISVMPIGHKFSMTSVEFCNSGSKSHRTLWRFMHCLKLCKKMKKNWLITI
ncbi:hypothetical protein GCM10017161_42010 [Thalassotalea marina]|uniref:Uncharacterized protein n=1 Tax=Thalassotalea marina TaxID=1673741 RepID=A0A919BS35_9GAMM|nr:hypothetical protein GCM10017161_42010 [Thalassotalea marina]